MVERTGCETCKKASLSLLLLRPSPIARTGLVAPLGVSGIAVEPAVVAGLLPTCKLTESQFVLRLLRQGYVHIYIPNPPAGVREWLVYRVTAEADLVPQGHNTFLQPEQNMACVSEVHIPTGMKVVSIPQAHKITDIWIAYSANLWNDTLRARNKADPAVMQKVSLKDGGPNTFKPTAEKLKTQVLECGISKVVIANSVEQDFPFNKLVHQVDDLVQGLQRAAARHPKTAGKELAVVLRDPVGICAELNALRLHRNQSVTCEFEKPEVMHPLNSSRLLMGLKKSVVDEASLASLDAVIPLSTAMGIAAASHPPGTEVAEITPAERRELLKHGARTLSSHQRAHLEGKTRMYLVIYPDVEQRAEKWKQDAAAQNWEKYSGYYDEAARAKWVKAFDARMRQEHYEPLQRMEDDWYSAVEELAASDYFDRHFDRNAGSDEKSALDCSIKAREHTLIYLPGPLTTERMTERYLAMLDQPLTAPGARVLRMIVGDKPNAVPLLGQQLSGDPAKDGGGMRDKTHDLVKGLVELMGTDSAAGKILGHTLALFSIGLWSALGGAFLTAASRGAAKVTPEQIKKLRQLSVVQRALEIAVQGAVKGKAPNLPVLLTMKVSAQEALEIRNGRPGEVTGTYQKRLEKLRRKGRMVELTLLTDTDAIKAANGDLDIVARHGSTGTVSIGTNATETAQEAAQGKTLVLSRDAFVRLYQRQMSTAETGANLVRRAAAEFNQPSTNLTALTKTLDARLAMAGMLVHALGIWFGYDKVANPTSESDRIDAEYGVAGNMVGFTGAALQLAALGVEMRLKRQHAALGGTVDSDAINKNLRLGALRILGAFTGIAGGYLDFAGSMKKSSDQDADGNERSSDLYFYSAYASAGTAITAGALSLGQLSQVLAARGIGGVVVRAVAARLAGNIALGAVGGLAVSVTGLGLLFLGAGVALQVGAIVMTPDNLQQWVARSYFGTDGGIIFVGRRHDRFPDWASEMKSLNEITNKAEAEQKKSRQR